MQLVGVDLGATHIAAGVVNREGKLLSRVSKPTLPERPWLSVVQDIRACVGEAVEAAGAILREIEAVGIGVPGNVDDGSGIVFACSNLHWQRVPLRQALSEGLPMPIHLANDANCAALAESIAGVSAHCDSSVFLTLGTGVGGGLMIHGRIFTGLGGGAGEFGHMVLYPEGLKCNCGRRGCMERYCSATALVQRARETCQAFPETDMLRRVDGNPENLDAKIVLECVRAGDPMALRVFSAFTRDLGLAIDNIIGALSPDMIVLGGGLSGAGELLLRAVRDAIPRCEMNVPRILPRIELARLGNEAGIIGAALLDRQSIAPVSRACAKEDRYE